PASITNIASYVTNTTATITWTTNRTADTQVDYDGTPSSYSHSTALDSSLVTTHSVIIFGLSPNTTYHFKVKSRDAASILATTRDYTFTTSSPPVITLSSLQDGNTG